MANSDYSPTSDDIPGPITDPDQARSYLNAYSRHVLRLGDTSFLHPDFAVNLANAVKQARQSGLPVSLESGYRAPLTTGSAYDAEGLSLHSYGAAADIGGIGAPGSPQAQKWAQIATQNGLSNPYGVDNPREYNHWQAVPYKLEQRPDVQAALKAAGGDLNKTWNAIAPVTAGVPDAEGEALLKAYVKPGTSSPGTQPNATAQATPVDTEGEALLNAYTKPAASAEAAPAVAATNAAMPATGPYPPGDTRNRSIQDLLGMTPQPAQPAAAPATPSVMPISDALGIGGPQHALGQYMGDRLAAIPGAIANDYTAAKNMLSQGVADIQAGKWAPSYNPNASPAPQSALSSGELDIMGRPVVHPPGQFPSGMSAGGAMNALTGAVGVPTSVLTGTVNQAVEQPVADLTGSPEIASRAGALASTLAMPQFAKGLSSAGRMAGDATIGALDPETAALADIARNKFGIPVNAGQMSPSPAIRIGSSALNRLPLSGAESDVAAQQTAFNGAVAKTFGEDATSLTPDVMNAARKRIGNDFETVAKNTTLQVDPQFVTDLHDVINDPGLTKSMPEYEVLQKAVKNIYDSIDQSDGTISGDVYQSLTKKNSPLDKLISNQNSTISNGATAIKDGLDGMLERSAPPDMANLIKQARSQWAALKTVQPLVAKAPTGDISPALLAGRVNATTGNGMAFGYGGDLGTLARIGQKFLKEPASSNTAERASALGMLGQVGLVGGGILGLDKIGMLPEMSGAQLAGSAAAIPASLLAGRAIGSTLRSNWLANRLINRSLPNAAGDSQSALAASLGVGGLSALNKASNLPVPVSGSQN